MPSATRYFEASSVFLSQRLIGETKKVTTVTTNVMVLLWVSPFENSKARSMTTTTTKRHRKDTMSILSHQLNSVITPPLVFSARPSHTSRPYEKRNTLRITCLQSQPTCALVHRYSCPYQDSHELHHKTLDMEIGGSRLVTCQDPGQ